MTATIRLAPPGLRCHCAPDVSPHDVRWLVEHWDRDRDGAMTQRTENPACPRTIEAVLVIALGETP